MPFNLTEVMRDVLLTDSPDLHLQVGQPPMIRLKNGDIAPMDLKEILTWDDVTAVINSITTAEQREKFEKELEVDFSYHIGKMSRFRVNIFHERSGPAVAFRMISEDIPTLDELGLGDTARFLAMQPNGLVLVTGPTGMGKSTTMASIIDYINANRKAHIITIEDPIEFVYKSKQSLITQREVNNHTHSFANAIRAALREDPDVVMVGEMRDLETIAAAITLAETGHLVFSTLHTSDAAHTIDRIIDVFPPYQQQQIRAQLAGTLKGVISQILVPRADGAGRVAAREVMIANDAVRNCISKGESHQIYSVMQVGAQEGMVLMDKSLEDLVKAGLITADEALSKATDPQYLQSRLSELVTA